MDGEHHQGSDEYRYATGRPGESEWIYWYRCDCAIQVSRSQRLRAISKRVLRIRDPNHGLRQGAGPAQFFIGVGRERV